MNAFYLVGVFFNAEVHTNGLLSEVIKKSPNGVSGKVWYEFYVDDDTRMVKKFLSLPPALLIETEISLTCPDSFLLKP